MPQGAYHFTGPAERSGIAFARLRHRSIGAPLEAGLTPECDIMSLHLSPLKGRAWSNGKIIHAGDIKADSLSLVKAGVQSDVAIAGDIDIVQVFLPPQSMAELSAEILGWPTQPIIDGWVFDRTLEFLTLRAFRASVSRHPAAFLAADALAIQLAERLLRQHGASGGPRLPSGPRFGGISPHRMRHLVDFIEANLKCELSLKALAAEVHLSPFHFLRAFQAETGITPHHWIMRRRIARAKQLLAHSDLPLAIIAAEVGYASQSALTAAFSKMVGSSPGRWRELRRL